MFNRENKWVRLLGLYGVIFIGFGAIALVFFWNTFLATAAYIEIGIGLICLVAYLFVFFGEAQKSLLRSQDRVFGLLGGLFLFLILAFVNVIANSQFGEKKFDLTTNKVHSLDESSVELVKELPQQLQIKAFVTDPRAKALLKNLVDKYLYHTNKISFEFIDPDRDPRLIEKYKAKVGEIVVVNTKTDKPVKLTSSQISEQEFSSAFRRALSGENKKVYFLQGHEEGDLNDQASKGLYVADFLLKREGYEVEALNLAKVPEIPSDADVVVGWGAGTRVPVKEVELIRTYLAKGGNLVLGIDPIVATTNDRLNSTGYESLLMEYGIELGRSMIIQSLNYNNRKIVSLNVYGVEYGAHPIAKELAGGITSFSTAQPVLQLKHYKGKASRNELVKTGAETAAEKNIKKIFSAKDASELASNNGPHPLAQFAELVNEDKKRSRIVVFGDSDFASNDGIQTKNNADFFLNTFGFLIGRPESITIRPKAWTTSTIEISDSARAGVYFASLFIIPQLIIIFGLAVWMIRRSGV